MARTVTGSRAGESARAEGPPIPPRGLRCRVLSRQLSLICGREPGKALIRARQPLPRPALPTRSRKQWNPGPWHATGAATTPGPGFVSGGTRTGRRREAAMWCARRDLNPHVLGHWNLNPARLPIPPRAPDHGKCTWSPPRTANPLFGGSWVSWGRERKQR